MKGKSIKRFDAAQIDNNPSGLPLIFFVLKFDCYMRQEGVVMVKGLTLQEYINFLQLQIDSGKIDGSLPVAVCSHANPKKEYWLLDSKSTTVEKYDDTAIITY